MNYELIKKNYERGLWTLPMVKMAVKKGAITCSQYQEITGEEYPASGDVSAAEALKEIQEVLGE